MGIALFGDRWEQYRPIRNFGCLLAVLAAGGLALIVFTPLATVWFQGVSGLSPELTAFALLPAQILALLPAGSVWICFQRSVLVHARQTAPITWAGILEVAVVVLLLTVTTQVLSWGRRGGSGDRDRGRAARRRPFPDGLHRESRAPAGARRDPGARPRRRRVARPVTSGR